MRQNKDASNGKAVIKGLWSLNIKSITTHNLRINSGNYGLQTEHKCDKRGQSRGSNNDDNDITHVAYKLLGGAQH